SLLHKCENLSGHFGGRFTDALQNVESKNEGNLLTNNYAGLDVLLEKTAICHPQRRWHCHPKTSG
ncbi:MAG: hypothetical protein VW935_18750, partial [Novosphingobium sp.]